MPNYSGMWSLSQQFQGRGQGLWPTPPGAPTIGTATAVSATSATVAFTAPACAGVPATITGYTATSTPGCITGTGASSPITVSGLTSGTAYTFKVKAQNATGFGACSAASNSVTPVAVTGQQAYTTSGTFSWVAPAGVTSVSVVAVGPGYWGGGGLGYRNNHSVTPGSSYSVVVGAGGSGTSSYFVSTCVVRGGASTSVGGGSYTGTGGGTGGAAGCGSCDGGGGGAGGYSGCGGQGGAYGTSGFGGGGGGGGGGGSNPGIPSGSGGGGVGILGQGATGGGSSGGGGGGSGGSSGGTAFYCCCTAFGGAGGSYGGGRGRTPGVPGASGGGAVRIIWPGTTRSFPSTNTGNL